MFEFICLFICPLQNCKEVLNCQYQCARFIATDCVFQLYLFIAIFNHWFIYLFISFKFCIHVFTFYLYNIKWTCIRPRKNNVFPSATDPSQFHSREKISTQFLSDWVFFFRKNVENAPKFGTLWCFFWTIIKKRISDRPTTNIQKLH